MQPNERRGEGGGGSSARDLRRTKVHDARRIDSQRSDAALKNGELNLQSFLECRRAEVDSLQNAMRNSKAAGSRRAFQLVPRTMRRRTASHNVKRLPKRLRQRARMEQVADNTPTIEPRKRRPRSTKARIRAETAKKLESLAKRIRNRKLKLAPVAGSEPQATGPRLKIEARPPRPKIRQNALNEPKLKSKFRKRQKINRWLPTHIWHAKRARMTAVAGFKMPLTPTEKCYRATHRSARESGAVCWDTSHMSTIRMYGDHQVAEELLGIYPYGDDTLHGLRKGTRSKSASLRVLCRPGLQKEACPLVVVVNPVLQSEVGTDTDKPTAPQRELLVRTNPADFQMVWDTLLRRIKTKRLNVQMEDLRWEIGSIDILGPAATEALQAILRPYFTQQEEEDPHARCFQMLGDLAASSVLPTDAVLSFSIRDPRLEWPPRRYHNPDEEDEEMMFRRLEGLATWPGDAQVTPSHLFDKEARYRASCLPSQKALARRRAAAAPGAPLGLTSSDPPIPITLMASFGPIQTWTIVAPRLCIQPLWYALMHCPLSTGGRPRFGGLREMQQIALEQARPWFPGDFPCTAAGMRWELEMRLERERSWNRRPKGKRTAWESLDLGAGRKGEIGSGFACDWELLFGIPRLDTVAAIDEQAAANIGEKDVGDELVPVPEILESPTLHDLIRVPGWSFMSFLEGAQSSPICFPGLSVVTVSITMLSRGEPKPCARIYRLPARPAPARCATQTGVPATDPPPSAAAGTLPPDLRYLWLASVPGTKKQGRQQERRHGLRVRRPQKMPVGADIEARKRLLAKSLLTTKLPYPPPKANATDMCGYPLVPGREDLIGFVTSGGFNLAKGRGAGIGHVSCGKAAAAVWDAVGPGDPVRGLEPYLCIVRNVGESVGWIAKWEVLTN